MKVQDALKSAIEILEAIKTEFGVTGLEPVLDDCKSALSDIEKCEPVGEPVENLEHWLSINMPAGTVIGDPLWWARKIRNVIAYTSPQPIEKCEPVTDTYVQLVPDKCDRIVYKNRYYSLDLLTSPISKEWVNLTDDDIENVWKPLEKAMCLDYKTYAQDICEKLKQLNAPEKG